MTTVESEIRAKTAVERQQFQLITVNDFDLCEDLPYLTLIALSQ